MIGHMESYGVIWSHIGHIRSKGIIIENFNKGEEP
jgi:hypothetical protein